MSNTEAQQWLDLHMKRADRLVFFFSGTPVLALAALPLAVATLLGACMSHAGGQLRHSEFREDLPPTQV